MTFLLGVTFVSMLLALVMSLVAWKVAREERERSEARVAALAADIHAVAPAAALAAGRRREPTPLRAVGVPPSAAPGADLFSATPASANSRPAIVVGVGLLIFATAAALIVVLGGNATATRSALRTSAAAATRTPSPSSAVPARVPLELVALGHDREGDRLTVRGVVRNPAGGVRADGLTAVVFMFERDGGFLGSGRGAIDTATLAPGGDSTFLVNVPGAASVARYRVSFRTETGIVAHVDKRTAQ